MAMSYWAPYLQGLVEPGRISGGHGHGRDERYTLDECAWIRARWVAAGKDATLHIRHDFQTTKI